MAPSSGPDAIPDDLYMHLISEPRNGVPLPGTMWPKDDDHWCVCCPYCGSVQVRWNDPDQFLCGRISRDISVELATHPTMSLKRMVCDPATTPVGCHYRVNHGRVRLL